MKHVLVTSGCALTVFSLGFVDWSLGHDIGFSIFYLAPITVAIYLVGLWSGVALSLLSAIVWYSADLYSGHVYASHWILIWNSVMRLGYFLLHSYFLSKFLSLYGMALTAANTDSLTGAPNARAFYDALARAVAAAEKRNRPFTLAYVDLDDFKVVNDAFGHQEGDELLRRFFDSARDGLEPGQTLARLGGDEFAFLLPDLDDEAAVLVLQRIKDRVEVDFAGRGWPARMSVGAVTFSRFDLDLAAMVRAADNLMYRAKAGGKGRIETSVHGPGGS